MAHATFKAIGQNAADSRLAEQKLRIVKSNLLIELLHQRLKDPGSRSGDLVADELVSSIAAGELNVESALEHLISPPPSTSVAAVAATEGAGALVDRAAVPSNQDSEGAEAAMDADAEAVPRGSPRLGAWEKPDALQRYWRGKAKPDGLATPIGTSSAEMVAFLAQQAGQRRHLRPHLSNPEMRFGGGFGQTERFEAVTLGDERAVSTMRGPAAYTPRWQATQRTSPQAPFTTASRTGGGILGADSQARGLGPGRPMDHIRPRSAFGHQADSGKRNMPRATFGAAHRDHGSALTGSEPQRRSRPGPGSYNA